MPQLVIPDVKETVLQHLRQRASVHGRSAEAEARVILETALEAPPPDPWAVIDAIREQLAASGHDFGDSTELIRGDRER